MEGDRKTVEEKILSDHQMILRSFEEQNFKFENTDYVEKPDEEKLVDAAVSGMLTSTVPSRSRTMPSHA